MQEEKPARKAYIFGRNLEGKNKNRHLLRWISELAGLTQKPH